MGPEHEPGRTFRLALEIEGTRRISGNDLFALLTHIDAHGSISRAASHLNLSYRYSWGLIREAEKVIGVSLISGRTGGSDGGETRLTTPGRELLDQYRSFRRHVDVHLSRLQRGDNAQTGAAPGGHLLIATTLEPVETGLLDVLEAAFHRATGVVVRHVAAGSGRALDIARAGRVDAVLTHAPGLEEGFVAEGWGERRTPVMANDFVLMGPPGDPAGIAALPAPSAAEDVLRAISATGSPFLSRGDTSGTHIHELDLWRRAGVAPAGSWYQTARGLLGNVSLARQAQERGAYALVDRASVLLARPARPTTSFPRPGDGPRPELANLYTFITVSAAAVPGVNDEGARLLATWLTGGEAGDIIARFGADSYGEPLFRLPGEDHVDRGRGAGVD